ncbi:MAG: hypothetical protein ACTIL2_07495 [Corynebacterium sp.]|uniref:hypothetical protein n=1 Tax=Corynebacterium sp. TaxID=1720 RepID=UPI003F946D9C
MTAGTSWKQTALSIGAFGAALAIGAAAAMPTAAAQDAAPRIHPEAAEGTDFDPGVTGTPETFANGIDLGQIGDLLENELILDYIEVCQTGDGPVPEDVLNDPDVTPTAVADCSQSTGDGIAVVLPESVEVGMVAEEMTVDLGDDINIPLVGTVRLGERNLIELISTAALGSDTIKNIVAGIPGLGLPRIDPTQLGKYSSYAQVQRDAALPVNMVTERECTGVVIAGRCLGQWVEKTQDTNLAKRTDALKIAEYLTGESYNYTQPVELPGRAEPEGTSTVIGDGTQVAAAMRGGNATAEAHQLLELPGIALAGADEERSSIAYTRLGFSSAMNMDTDEIGVSWFGNAIDFTALREAGIVDFAGEEIEDMLTMVDDLDIPALKEVSCFGLFAHANAEGLGSCANILGTFDSYQDLRDPEPGESRQTQVGITDVTSLVLGNDALLKQFTGETEDTPFLDDLMADLTSEDDRLTFAKDFVRYTTDRYTEEIEGPDGETTTRTTIGAWVTSDYGLREPVTVEWLGHRVVFFPAVEVNGNERPNLIGLPELERIADDSDAGLLPKVSLVTWDNAFGLGTVVLDNLTRPDVIYGNWRDSVTLGDDISWLAELAGVGGSDGSDD